MKRSQSTDKARFTEEFLAKGSVGICVECSLYCHKHLTALIVLFQRIWNLSFAVLAASASKQAVEVHSTTPYLLLW